MGRASDTRSEARNWQELEEHCATLKAERDKWQQIAADAIAQRDAAKRAVLDEAIEEFDGDYDIDGWHHAVQKLRSIASKYPPLSRVQKGEEGGEQ